MREKIKDKRWYPYIITAGFAVTLYVSLTHIDVIIGVLCAFAGYFSTIIYGCAFAYLINPLANWNQKKIFKKIKPKRIRWILSVALAVFFAVLFLAFILGLVVPQIMASVKNLITNMDGYLNSLQSLIQEFGIRIDVEKAYNYVFGADGTVVTFVKRNPQDVLNASADAGKTVVEILIAFILSVYMLLAKDSIRKHIKRFFKVVFSEKVFHKTSEVFNRCNDILVQYVTFSIIDAGIIGTVNAVFMAILGMQYIGLISLVVGVFNLIPTFGPLIGGAIGGFILLLVNPWHALMFVIFTLILQICDGYILKPKLFSGSLGVPGLLILCAVIVFGKMFGVSGIILSIPSAAVISFLYQDELMPWLEERKKNN